LSSPEFSVLVVVDILMSRATAGAATSNASNPIKSLYMAIFPL
jgi:hypothetical protein